MARIIYALSGQGRGHTSRVIAISDELRRRGHDVVFCCGGIAREILEAEGEPLVPVQALRQVVQCNEVQVGRTARANWNALLKLRPIVTQLADAFSHHQPDLLITDFEAFSPRAAERIGIPVLSFNHQQVVTETRYALPARHWAHALITAGIIKVIAPNNPRHILLSSFFFPPLKRPDRATLVPPIIRPAVQNLRPRKGEHVLVYFNQPEGADYVLNVLRTVNASFIVYNFTPPPSAETYTNIRFKTPSLEGFLNDLATSRAVLCTAGFTLMSEAIYLGKPLLVVPNQGIFEQTLNALFLQREGWGEAVINRALTRTDVETFLALLDTYEERLGNRPPCGNQQALACIEAVLSELEPALFTHPGLPYPAAQAEPVAMDAIAKPN